MIRLANFFARFREESQVWLNRLIILILLSGLFFVTLGGVSHNSKWQITQVDVVGAKTISDDAVRSLAQEKLLGNYFFVYARDNSYLFPHREIEQTLLDAFPRIASVSAVREGSNTIAITISERKPYALWCGEEFHPAISILSNCWFIDDTGFVFDQAPVFSGGVYLEVYGKLVEKKVGETLSGALPSDRFAMVNSFVKLLRLEVGDTLRVNIKPEEETEITLRGNAEYPFLAGVVVRFTEKDEPAVLVKNLLTAIPVQFPGKVALKKKLLYIDIRFGNKIFFGFEN